MAGKLVIDQLQDSSGNSGKTTDAIKGSARAWVNFNGVTTATIRASYNVSSVTRNGTGDYTVNFASALSDANYAAVAMSRNIGTGSNGATHASVHTTVDPTTSAFRFFTTSGWANGIVSSAPQDTSINTIAFFGN